MEGVLHSIFSVSSVASKIPKEWYHKTLDELFDEREDLSDDLALEMEKHNSKNLRNGFFIEAGASEGSNLSRRMKT